MKGDTRGCFVAEPWFTAIPGAEGAVTTVPNGEKAWGVRGSRGRVLEMREGGIGTDFMAGKVKG